MPICVKCKNPSGYNPKTGKPNKLCRLCFQKNGGKKITKNKLDNSFTKHVFSKRIDIDSLYRQLKSALNERSKYQVEQDDLWKYIKHTHANRSRKMESVSSQIGQNTHKINIILNELTKYNKTHKAMNMAYNYLENEISRTKKKLRAGKKLFMMLNAEDVHLLVLME